MLSFHALWVKLYSLNILISPCQYFNLYTSTSHFSSPHKCVQVFLILILYFKKSLMIWIPFISFSSLIAIARTSRTMFNNRGKVDILVLLLILGKCFPFFTIENNVCYRLIIYGLYYVGRRMELEGSTCLISDYTTKLQSSRQYGTSTKTEI